MQQLCGKKTFWHVSLTVIYSSVLAFVQCTVCTGV